MNAVDNVVFLIEEEPTEEQMVGTELVDGQPGLLGLHEGTALTDRDDGWSGALPDTIFIFRGTMSRLCESREELTEEIAVTVTYEIAHRFGIDDDRLHDLGWA
ncbi:metallopeptidase family protein [Flaviflexus ciconiae]|uniref:Metallopeptidase family protein n=2 Tax=Flaviflexus ciconiae TaxID=2496867 RepID=A0A3S9Q0X5_9ACTO|nr:metallopeptidase family protein [Flaviflexus ciconiae]